MGPPLSLPTVPVTEIVTVTGAAFAGRALVVTGNAAWVAPGVTSTYAGTWAKFVLLLSTEYRFEQFTGIAGPVNWIVP